jgi:hypothetical protein
MARVCEGYMVSMVYGMMVYGIWYMVWYGGIWYGGGGELKKCKKNERGKEDL